MLLKIEKLLASGAKTAFLCILRSAQIAEQVFAPASPNERAPHTKLMERTSLKLSRHLAKNEHISASVTQQLCDLLAFSRALVAWRELLANLPWLMVVTIYFRSDLIQDAAILICTVGLGQANKILA